MVNNPRYKRACEILLDAVRPVGKELVCLSHCGGRILAQEFIAVENVPPFDRSPYEGYALRAADTANASADSPVTLRILEEIAAGDIPTMHISPMTASKVLTGAPIPPGADVVIMHERTKFTADAVTVFSPLRAGNNIVCAGEDIRKGELIALDGTVIDPGLAGSLAAQGVAAPMVYKRPSVAVISTGKELCEANECPGEGKIRNSNRYMMEAALRRIGCEPVYFGAAEDRVDSISTLIRNGLEQCDAVITTGGVSGGDYDLTRSAMEKAGAKLLFQGTNIKPGMACAYAVADGRLICGLSGNPASALTNLYVVAMPALKKLTGVRNYMHREIRVKLSSEFGKKSPVDRFLRGRLELRDGVACIELPKHQGNVMLSSAIGCDVMALVPAGSGPVDAGTELSGFLL